MGLWATSTFSRETLTLEAGCQLISDVSAKSTVPIIASVAASDLRPESWLKSCTALENAGAAALQLDLFYLPAELVGAELVVSLAGLFRILAAESKIPLVPKLNIDIPPQLAAAATRDTGIAGLSFLDSVTLPPPLLFPSLRPAFRFHARPNRASLFGSWQLPLTLSYTYRLARLTSLPLCAGGGMMSAADALQAIVQGATAVQFATMVLLRGFIAIRRALDEFESLVSQTGRSLAELRGFARHDMSQLESQSLFDDVCAVTNPAECIACGECLKPAFCHAISLIDSVARHDPDLCDGCSLCTHICPRQAISLVPRTP
jgi:ferredoxin